MRKIISRTEVQGVKPSNKQLNYFNELKEIDNMIENKPDCKSLKRLRSLTVFLIKMN